jgi:hypothetical protein
MTIDNRFEPLPSELRRRRQQLADEAKHGVDWLDSCPPQVGRKIAAAMGMLTNRPERVYSEADRRRGYSTHQNFVENGSKEALEGEGDDGERLDVVATVLYSFLWLAERDDEEEDSGYSHVSNYLPEYDTDKLIEVVNDLLLHARVEWVFEDGKFQERGNSILHDEVVRPTTVFLDADPKFTPASGAFQTALTHLSENKPSVAITDAATAVQEFFRVLGAQGNSLSDQMNNAQKKGIITSNDRALLKPFADWLNGDRSDKGNAHYWREGDVSKSDAWLAIHVAGALMVRLSNEEPRNIMDARVKRMADAEAARVAEEERVAAEAAQKEAERSARFEPWNSVGSYGEDTPF